MHITIQPLEITYNQVPHRFIVKKVFGAERKAVTFHCWAPDNHYKTKDLMKSDILLFEWDEQKEELRAKGESPLCNELRAAIQRNFSMEAG